MHLSGIYGFSHCRGNNHNDSAENNLVWICLLYCDSSGPQDTNRDGLRNVSCYEWWWVALITPSSREYFLFVSVTHLHQKNYNCQTNISRLKPQFWQDYNIYSILPKLPLPLLILFLTSQITSCSIFSSAQGAAPCQITFLYHHKWYIAALHHSLHRATIRLFFLHSLIPSLTIADQVEGKSREEFFFVRACYNLLL
jgi:hypothetical protein